MLRILSKGFTILILLAFVGLVGGLIYLFSLPTIPLHKKNPDQADVHCIPQGWSLVQLDDRSLLLQEGAPEHPAVFWAPPRPFFSTSGGSLYIEAGADDRCPFQDSEPPLEMPQFRMVAGEPVLVEWLP